jgi:hypothetical protein
MKYEPPYGSPGTNDPYINGNPSTGTMGSIPPAASIENPQREIVNLIADAGGTPADTDLHQLARGVQSGHLNYAIDSGTANALAINVTPALLAYAAGQRWLVRVLNTNTGPSVININALGARHIVYPDGTELKGGELHSNGLASLVDDGTHLQLSNVSSAAGGLLTAPKTYYVNAATGDDNLYDGTTATVSGTHGPFATVQRALTACYTWNQNGFSITIYVADGTYPPFAISQPPNGAGTIYIIGNLSAADNVLFHATSGEAIAVTANGYSIQGVAVQSDAVGASPHLGCGFRIQGASINLKNITFFSCATAHMLSDSSALILLMGNEMGSAEAADYLSIKGDSPYHMLCVQNSLVHIAQPILYTVATRNISVWAQTTGNAVISGFYQSQSLGGAVNGQKYNCSLNGVVNTQGAGVNYFPGTVAGATISGGQYG